MRPLALFLSALFAISVGADKDSNIYPWGSNPNINKKMYWKDSANVLQDLDKFSALYIKVHNCVWSEFGLGMNYDDDGENHDGDGNWYMTRVQPFRANAAFSLYGTLREDSSFGGGCKKRTYINSFFTYMGADSIVRLLELGVSAFPDSSYGSNKCYEYYDENSGNNKNNGKDRRDLKSGDNNQNSMSTTMGCAEDGTFANAKFLGSDCDGNYFLNITDTLDDYNAAMEKVSCYQVWNYHKEHTSSRSLGQNYNDDAIPTTYGSIAEKLLYTSFACDLDQYPEACPNPYGLKSKYTNSMKSAASGGRRITSRSSTNGVLGNWRNPVLFFSWFFLVIGLAFVALAYKVKNRRFIDKEGGGAEGFSKVLFSDLKTTVVKGTVKALACDRPSTRSPKSSKKRKGAVQKKGEKQSKSGIQLSRMETAEKEGAVESNSDANAMDFNIMPDENDQKASSQPSSEKRQKTGFLQSLRRSRSKTEVDDDSTFVGEGERYSTAEASVEKDGLWVA